MPWACFLPCSNGSYGVRRAFFGVFCSSSCLHMIRRRQRWPSDIPSERSESDFAVFRSRGRVILAMSGLRMIRRPTVLPTRGGAGAVTLQNTPFFARARMGYLRRTRRYPVNIYNLYRNLYKTKRQTAQGGCIGVFGAPKRGSHAPYTLSECENGLTRCQA